MADLDNSHDVLRARLSAIEDRLRTVFMTYSGPASRPHRTVVADTLMLLDQVRRAPNETDTQAVEMIAGVLEVARDVRQARRMERILRLRLDAQARRLNAVVLGAGSAGLILVAIVVGMVIAAPSGDGDTMGLNRQTCLGAAFGILSAGSVILTRGLRDRVQPDEESPVRIAAILLADLSIGICGAVGLVGMLHVFDWALLAKALVNSLSDAVIDLVVSAAADGVRHGTADAASAYLSALVGCLFAREVLLLLYWGVTKPFGAAWRRIGRNATPP